MALNTQGGTWRQVHLLGTAALDRFRGYVGQSRGQLPTHTWNTRSEADHPAWLVADDRSAPEVVADAMARNEPKSFAAADDPWVLDRQLRAERDEHAAVLANRPPDRTNEQIPTQRAMSRAQSELDAATSALEYRERERARLAGLRRLRPGNRHDLARAEVALDATRDRHQRAEERLHLATAAASEVTDAFFDCAAWDNKSRWRVARVAEIDQVLDRHWAQVTLAAVRADDPLAFGIERLRAARRSYGDELRRLLDDIPPDRRKELGGAEAALSYRRQALRQADERVADARLGLGEAELRHRFGLRDRRGIEHAETLLHTAEGDQRLAARGLSLARERAANEADAVQVWLSATQTSAGRRGELVSALDHIDDALRRTRPDRVRELAADPTSDLWVHLGPPPSSRGGLAAWCGIAERVEAWRDHASGTKPKHPGPFPDDVHPLLGHRPVDWWVEWGELARLVGRSDVVISKAVHRYRSWALGAFADVSSWQSVVEPADDQARELGAGVQRGRGIDL